MTETPGSALEPWLLEILACPQCRSPLRLEGDGSDGSTLACTDDTCRLVYRIDDGIPVLLIDEATRR